MDNLLKECGNYIIGLGFHRELPSKDTPNIATYSKKKSDRLNISVSLTEIDKSSLWFQADNLMKDCDGDYDRWRLIWGYKVSKLYDMIPLFENQNDLFLVSDLL